MSPRVPLQRFYRLFTLWGAPVYMHWTAVALLAFILLLTLSGGIPLLFLAAAWFALILVHELGHAWVARRLGCEVLWIHLSPLHGRCAYEGGRSRRDECVVAWGGVLAQGALLLPAAGLWVLADDSLPKVLNLALGVFTWWNAATLLFNLTPAHPFDGALAWSLLRARRGRTGVRGRPRR